MSQSNKPLIEEIVLPNKLAVFEDKKTKVKSVAFPFTFPDGAHGYVTITRLRRTPWTPSDDIKNVVINFNDHNPVA